MPDHPRRGEIYRVDFNPVKGSEQAGVRPAVIVSNNIANQRSPCVSVVPITSTIPLKNYPQNVSLPAHRPLQEAGTIYCGQVRTVSKERLRHHMADLSAEQMAAIDQALIVALGLPKQPRSTTAEP